MEFVASVVTSGNVVLCVEDTDDRGLHLSRVEVSLGDAIEGNLELYRTAIGSGGTAVGNVLYLPHRVSGETPTAPFSLRTVGFTENADEKVGTWFFDRKNCKVDFPCEGLELRSVGGARWGLAFKITLPSATDVSYVCYGKD